LISTAKTIDILNFIV